MTTTETTIGINGMAHVMLTVSQFAAARAFYGRLLPALGMTPVCDTDKLFYCVGARTAIGIQPAGSAHDGAASCKAGLACTISACEPVRAKT
jgi:catechol 2,3-dioxygenase-like lactoylglutathione lyase family enzyme